MSQGANVYQLCLQTYPTVCWDEQAFLAHLARRDVPHTADLYLGGAAGHRIDAAWEVIEKEKSTYVRRSIQKFAKADFTVEELWSETRTRLAEALDDLPLLPDGRRCARILKYGGETKIEAYCVTVAVRVAIARQRRKKPQVLDFTARPADGGPSIQFASTSQTPADSAEKREEQEAVLNAVLSVFPTLTPRERLVIKLMWIGGMNQKQAAEYMNDNSPDGKPVKDYTVTRLLDSVRKKFGTAIREKLGGDPSPEALLRAGEMLDVILKDDV
jgi:RNA polymerase sigma factor (sigma-70 family)